MVFYPSFSLHVYFGPFHTNRFILLDPFSQSVRSYQLDCNDDDDIWFVVNDDFAFFGSTKTNPFMHILLYDVRYFLLIKKEIKNLSSMAAMRINYYLFEPISGCVIMFFSVPYNAYGALLLNNDPLAVS